MGLSGARRVGGAPEGVGGALERTVAGETCQGGKGLLSAAPLDADSFSPGQFRFAL